MVLHLTQCHATANPTVVGRSFSALWAAYMLLLIHALVLL